MKKTPGRERVGAGWLVLGLLTFLGAPALANESLAKKNGCTACHAMTSKVMGPSFRSIADKYAGNAAATDLISKSIREGGSGQWGTLPMPPQTQLSAQTVKALATWVALGAK